MEAEYTAIVWLVYPPGLYGVIQRHVRDYPFAAYYLIENGAAFDDPAPKDGHVPDPSRRRYLAAHLAQVRRVFVAGIDLRGYFVWSLLDNFEWRLGYTKRLGLTCTDFKTLDRTVKDSGHWYGRLIRTQRAG